MSYYNSGETGAGKSTFINLLLGEDILPESTLSCTAGICKLLYGEKRSARITEIDGSVRQFFFDECKDPIAELQKVIFPTINRDDGSPFKEVEIFLPADILKVSPTNNICIILYKRNIVTCILWSSFSLDIFSRVIALKLSLKYSSDVIQHAVS